MNLLTVTRCTRQQINALWRVYNRTPLGVSWRAFRRSVKPSFGMDNAVIISWQGMWLAIETDGYCHS